MQVGGGGEVEFLTEKKISAKKCSWGLKTAKKKKKKNFFEGGGGGGRKISRGGGGGFWGVWGAPRPHPGVARGRKTIHFFLCP